MVLLLVVWVISKTSGHSKWASMARKYIFPWNGPAKSICTCCQGLHGQDHGCMGALGGACLTDWQDSTRSSMSRSRFSHMTACNGLHPWDTWMPTMQLFQHDFLHLGIMTRMTHIRHPSSIVSSCCLAGKGFNALGSKLGQPDLVYWNTLMRIGSFQVAFQTAVAVMGKAWIGLMMEYLVL